MSNVTAIALIGLGIFGIYLGATGRLLDTWQAATGSFQQATGTGEANGQGGEGGIMPSTRGGYYGTTLGVLNVSDEGYY